MKKLIALAVLFSANFASAQNGGQVDSHFFISSNNAVACIQQVASALNYYGGADQRVGLLIREDQVVLVQYVTPEQARMVQASNAACISKVELH